jgi:hypothetical protein
MSGPRGGDADIEISLRAHSRAIPFVFVIGGLSLVLAAEASLLGIVSSFKAPVVGRRLLALEANDPRLQDRLGRAYEGIDLTESLRHLRRATQLSPASRLYWEDLELACESSGDTRCADQAVQRLVQLCPMVPSYHWLAAQSCLRANRLDLAVKEFQRLLALDPAYARSTWLSLLTLQKPESIFQELSADTPDARLKVGYVDFLSSLGENDTAYRIWRLVAADPSPFPYSFADPYLERLIGLGRMDEAINVWQDLERLGTVKRPGAGQKDNLVFNGDFEQAPLNGGFDWRGGSAAFVAVDFSAPGAYHGARCLRVDFTVDANNEYEPVYQIVPVLPHHTYRLKAFLRSEEITSDTGPCLRVSDTQGASFPDAVSETTVGTTPWHPVRLSFSTGPQTQAVRLSLWRPRSRTFPTAISGTCWLDVVSLECLDCQELEARSQNR